MIGNKKKQEKLSSQEKEEGSKILEEKQKNMKKYNWKRQ